MGGPDGHLRPRTRLRRGHPRRERAGTGPERRGATRERRVAKSLCRRRLRSPTLSLNPGHACRRGNLPGHQRALATDQGPVGGRARSVAFRADIDRGDGGFRLYRRRPIHHHRFARRTPGRRGRLREGQGPVLCRRQHASAHAACAARKRSGRRDARRGLGSAADGPLPRAQLGVLRRTRSSALCGAVHDSRLPLQMQFLLHSIALQRRRTRSGFQPIREHIQALEPRIRPGANRYLGDRIRRAQLQNRRRNVRPQPKARRSDLRRHHRARIRPKYLGLRPRRHGKTGDRRQTQARRYHMARTRHRGCQRARARRRPEGIQPTRHLPDRAASSRYRHQRHCQLYFRIARRRPE